MMVESRFDIMRSDGMVKQCTVKKLEYNGTYMGERYVSVTVSSPIPLNWNVGDYIEYRGERFTLSYIPAISRQARSGSRGDAIVYEDVRFKGTTGELERVQFVDVVPGDNQIPYSAMGTFTFFVSKVRDFAVRVQANLDEAYGDGVWTVECEEDLGVTKEKPMSINGDTSVYAALAQFNNTFHVNFTVRNHTITFGGAQKATGHSYVYGKGHGLRKLTQSVDSNQKVVTRAKCYGSTRNIPYMYYVTISRTMKLNVYNMSLVERAYGLLNINTTADWKDIYFIDRIGTEQRYNVSVRIGGRDIRAIAKITDEAASTLKMTIEINTAEGHVTFEELQAFRNSYYDHPYVYLSRGVNFANVPSTMWYIPEGAPDNYSIHNLMLPGFPKQSLAEWVSANADANAAEGTVGKILADAVSMGYGFSDNKFRPYITAPALYSHGLRDGEKTFDQDDDKNEWWEIYPSLEGMTTDSLRGTSGYVAGARTADTDGRVDKILSGSTIADNGTSMTGDFSSGQKDNNGVLIEVSFKIEIPNIGFDLWKYKTSSDTPKLSMRTGMCAGREFEIINCIPRDNPKDGYTLTLNRSLDSNIDRNFPYSDFQINAGDEYVLLGIEMPDVYVEASSVRLLLQSLDWLDENSKERYTYQPQIDNIWMARHEEESSAITEGMKMLIADEELGYEVAVTIAQLTIKEGQSDNAVTIPQYEVRLDDEQEATLMQSVEATVRNAIGKTDFSSSFAGINKRLDTFLQKTQNDSAPHHYMFGSILVGEIVEHGGEIVEGD